MSSTRPSCGGTCPRSAGPWRFFEVTPVGTSRFCRESAEERWAVERGLQLCAQNALDVATHIAVGLGRDVSDYGSAIDVLADARVLSRAFVTDFRSVAGFRNVIVHGYLEVDVSVLHAVLNERLDDFLEFADLVEAYLESSPRR